MIMIVILAVITISLVGCFDTSNVGQDSPGNENDNGQQIQQLHTPIILSTAGAIISLVMCNNSELFRVEIGHMNNDNPFFSVETTTIRYRNADRINLLDFDRLIELYEEGVFEGNEQLRLSITAIGDGIRFSNSKTLISAIRIPSLADFTQ